MSDRKSIPKGVILLFSVDLILCFSYMINYLIGEPSWKLTLLLNLNGEMNLPTWYSSVQLFCLSALFGLFAFRNFERSQPSSWGLLLFPLIFLAFSLDEVATIHEWLGHKLDVMFLPTGGRKATFFRVTGIWMLGLGVPVLSGLLVLFASLRKYFARPPHVFKRMALGVILYFGGALGVETLSNLPEEHFGQVIEAFFEEFFEMAGVTVLLWAVLDLLSAHGFSWQLDAVKMEQPSDGMASPPAGESPGSPDHSVESPLAIRSATRLDSRTQSFSAIPR